jgi:hypothetical protein
MPRARRDVEVVLLDGDAVVHDADTQALHRLNETATLVWLRCDGRTPIASIVDDLATASGAPIAQVEADVRGVLADFARNALVTGDGQVDSVPRVSSAS